MDESLSALRPSFGSTGWGRISYADEGWRDRDAQGVLWARVSQSLDEEGALTGAPRWRMINPARQRETMSKLLCQVCREPARTDQGILFPHSTEEGVPDPSTTVLTAQPPLCPVHAPVAPKRCPHLAKYGSVALLAQSAPLYGVIGTPHRYMPDRSIQVMACDGVPVPYGHADMAWMVATQLVRTLRAFTVVNLDDL
ncbi:hypothetical protein JQK87_01710 [Streptomyces sp. G44]|uniref:hypothetical protein n=1 Tax=Streptomyces sp. G44 TaxID=2807632 RepID=UPI00195F4299|nr:hypothetical protein [Streptomyces sp. G44]MBM7167158.1 hypothetical protein [Streptomyces sp. G44]